MERAAGMKYSIKKRLAFIFIALMACTLLGCWVLNSFLLPTYYENNRQKALLATYKLMDRAAEGDSISEEAFQIELEKISGRYNIMGVVQDMNALIIITFGNNEDMLRGLLWDRLYMPAQSQQILKQEEEYVICKAVDSKTRTEYMEMTGWLSGGQAFYMRTPLENIRESVLIVNRFLLYVGAAAIALSSMVIWLVSRKIAEPILELAHISEKMTDLDFDVKYKGKSRDEIGLLGENINLLSKALEETIRDLKTANNELEKDIERKDRIDEMRREFLANVSHELKTPIALIQGYAEGLKEDINEDAEGREFYCEVIMDEAAKMNTMVKKLLTLNELEFGKDVVKLERFDVVSLIQNYLQSAQLLTRQNQIQLRMEHYEPVYVWADEYKTEEVFANYFSNAVHHCGGQKLIDIRISRKENAVRVTVFNTGNPIPEESISHIWEKFYKVDKARTREYGGSGVGLSIVKAIMESMNQHYGVENYENGVAFWFELETVRNGAEYLKTQDSCEKVR